ncbi:MAG: pantetheine-phosphate adenylyltransferase [Anaerolineae bacterium]|nr:pantetheine-phosphate adenylyltransferase [Anaerolineae bacterium]
MAEAIYPATFDPITNGHVEIAERAARLFDRLVVGVYDKPLKNWLFSIEERLEMTGQALAHLDNVQIERYGGLTVNFAQERNATYIVRGLRTLSDFEWELQLSQANHGLTPEIETVCLLASQKNSFLSSSILKEIALNDGKIDHLAPPVVVAALRRKLDV